MAFSAIPITLLAFIWLPESLLSPTNLWPCLDVGVDPSLAGAYAS